MGSPQQPPAFSERAAPHNIEAEQSVLGSMLLEPAEMIPLVRTVLTDADFYSAKHASLFRVLCWMAEKRKLIDLITIQDTLRKPVAKDVTETHLDQLGGIGFLTSLMNFVPTTGPTLEHARIVQTKAELRRLADAGRRITDSAYEADRDTTDAGEATAKAKANAEAALRKVTVTQQSGKSLSLITGIVDRALVRVAEMGQPDPKQIEFGLAEFDHFPWRAGELLAIHAPSGNGKSTVVRALAKGAAARGSPTAFFSLEMDQEQTETCFIAAEGRLSLMRCRNMKRVPLTPEERTAYIGAAARLNDLPLLMDYVPEQRMSDIRAKCLAAAMQHGGLKVIVIDYAGIIGDTPESWQRHEQMMLRLHYEAQWLAREVGAFVIMVDQALDEMLRRANPTPNAMDFADARSIKRAVDHAIGLIIPENCIESGAGRNKIIPAFPVPGDGDSLAYNDTRLQNVIMGAYTKGRYGGGRSLLPLFHDGRSGHIGNLMKRPWALKGSERPSEAAHIQIRITDDEMSG